MSGSKMRKVLVVAYAFPPVGGAGVQRSTKFIKYLKDFGWEPIVLSVKNPSVPLFDSKQISDIPAQCTVYKAKTFEPQYKLKRIFFDGKKNNRGKRIVKGILKWVKNKLMIPDPQILWWPGLFLSLFKIIKKESIDCLFVTAPPFSSLVPVIFVGRLFRIPVVPDFRDEWGFNRLHMENAVRTPFSVILDRILERYVILNCAAFTAATTSYVKSILNKYPTIKQKKGHTITNGYDAEDFLKLKNGRYLKRNGLRINFLYSGTVWNATSLLPFVKAIKLLVGKNPQIANKMHIRIIGRVVDQEIHYLKDKQLENLVELTGYIPHDDVLYEMSGSDVLLITLSDLPGADQIIPAKTFEYMATGKHIMAIVPEGETSRLLDKEYGNAIIIDPSKVDLIATRILKLVSHQEWLMTHNEIDVSKYERKFLTRKLAMVFSLVTKKVKGM
jgi:glycosyltransferase involved in cell wall biosynthesis